MLSLTALVIVLALAADTWRQSKVWHDSETLWAWAVDVDPDWAICHDNLGSAIFHSPARTSSTPALAEAQFRKVVALRPERPGVYRNLGWTLAFQGRYAEAEIPVREFMRRSPRVPQAPGLLGMLYLDQGRYGEAIPLLRQALRMEPRFARGVPTWRGPSGRRPRRSGGGGRRPRRRPWRLRPPLSKDPGRETREPPQVADCRVGLPRL